MLGGRPLEGAARLKARHVPRGESLVLASTGHPGSLLRLLVVQ